VDFGPIPARPGGRTIRRVSGEEAFGALLRRHRRQAGLSQEELAARAFVSTRAISDLERGVNARPRLHTAIALADGLGLDGPERAVFERHARPDLESVTSPASLLVPPRARPPLALDSFVDDGARLDQLVAVVGDRHHRLVTLLGPGGIGKTRLALEMAQRLEGAVAFVALGSLSDPTLVAATIGDALQVEHGPSRTHLQSLVEHLAPHELTLVLDNMEQITDAAGDVATLMRSCPGLSIVVTSRVPLRIAGELRYVVRPLDATGATAGDPADRPGVRLFLERAAATGFDVGERVDQLAAVAELCRRLDGLPLAIELAAARSRVVPPREMLGHLDRVLDLLGTGRSDAPTQHQSMRAALEWSYRLLSGTAQRAFDALGVFAAGASKEATMEVWGLASSSTPTFFDLVQDLAEAHLVSVEQAGHGTGLRVDMFETTRQFAREKLSETGAAELVYQRFTQWALDLVAEAEPALTGPDQLEWLDRLDRELANLRAVGRHLAQVDTEDAIDSSMRLVAGLQRFWDIRSRWNEGLVWLSDVLARPGGAPAVRAKAHKALGVMHRSLGHLDAAEVEQARAVELFASAGDELGVASCTNNRGVIALDRADYERAEALLSQALAVCEAHGADGLEAIVLNNLSLATIEIGDLRQALRLSRRSRRLLAARGNFSNLSWTDDNTATVLTMAGRPRRAVAIHQQAIRQRMGLGDEAGLVWSLEALSAAWTATGDVERAGQALGFVAAHRRRLGTVPVPYLTALTERRSAALIAKIGQDRFAELWEQGAGLDPTVARERFTT
jgi:predicted ATPase/DNA-binding XRE family transcriptional regulator